MKEIRRWVSAGSERPALLFRVYIMHNIRRVRISCADGLHMRAAHFFSQKAREFPCGIRVSCGDRHADAKNIWELMSLIAETGRELVLEAEGFRGDEALDQLERFVASGFQISGGSS